MRPNWIPFIDAPHHTISNEGLLCQTKQGKIYPARFVNEQWTEDNGALIDNVTAYINDVELRVIIENYIKYAKVTV